MKRFTTVFAAVFCVWSWAARTSLTCQVYGCTTDTVSLERDSNQYRFEFSEDMLSDYALNYNFTEAFADAGLLGPDDRIDHIWITMKAKDCAQARGKIGDITCKGNVEWAAARVRRNEKFIAGTNERRHTFTWDTLSATTEKPWGFELRVLPGSVAAESEWAVVLTLNGKPFKLYPFVVNQCRHSF